MVALSPVPEISISFAPPEEPSVEPFSPFSSCSPSPATPVDSDSFRAVLLTPPPSHSPRQHSPLRPSDVPNRGCGIGRERFEELLRASKERNATLGTKRSAPDLRKEIAIKAHKSKQAERRALFLSKIRAPPSPGATLLPKTPPESPAIFHYSLPSPGLQSPLAVFEQYATEDPAKPPRQTWVEQVEFRVPGQLAPKRATRSAPAAPKGKLPSLDQISARLNAHSVQAAAPRRDGSRLPAFLQPADTHAQLPSLKESRPAAPPSAPAAENRFKLAAAPAHRGPFRFPVRQPAPPTPESREVEIQAPSPRLPPSPRSPLPKIQITTTVVPPTASTSPTAFTESNVRALNLARERTAQDMLTRLRRRTLQPGALERHLRAHDFGKEDDGRKHRRHSAPPELAVLNRGGFLSPKLDIPGAF